MTVVAAAVPDSAAQGKLRIVAKIIMVIAAIGAAYVAVNAVSGAYHLLDIIPAFHSWWHHTVPDKATRNDYRDVWEYLTGGYAAQLYTWNSAKWHAKGGGGLLDRLSRHVPGLSRFRQWVRRFPLTELGASYVLSLPAAAIGFVAVYFATRAIPAWSWQVPVPHFRHALLLSSLIVNHKAMGLAASYFFGRHMMRMAYDDVQYKMADAAAHRQRNLLSWLWLPTYRARVQSLRGGSAADGGRGHRLRQAALISFSGLVALALAAYGFLVLKYLAHGHPMPWGLR